VEKRRNKSFSYNPSTDSGWKKKICSLQKRRRKYSEGFCLVSGLWVSLTVRPLPEPADILPIKIFSSFFANFLQMILEAIDEEEGGSLLMVASRLIVIVVL